MLGDSQCSGMSQVSPAIPKLRLLLPAAGSRLTLLNFFRRRAHCYRAPAVGKVKWKVAPRPELAVAHKRPPCDSMMERLIVRPMPEPCGLVVKK